MPMTLRARRLPSGFWKGSSGRSTVRRSKSTRAVKSLAPRARKAVATIAKRVMKKSQETKYVSEALVAVGGSPFQVYGDVLPLGGTPQIIPTLPLLAEGVAPFQRVGQQVQPVRHTTTLDIEFNSLIQDISGGGGLDACAWDINVHIWYGFARRYKKAVDITGANAIDILSNMLEKGDGTNQKFGGAPHDALFKANTDVLQVKRKSFRMFRPFGAQNQATLAGGLTTYYPQMIKKRVKLSFKVPKKLKYDEVDTDPENYAPFFIIGYEHNDNTQASNDASTPPGSTILTKPAIQFVGRSELWFKDA